MMKRSFLALSLLLSVTFVGCNTAIETEESTAPDALEPSIESVEDSQPDSQIEPEPPTEDSDDESVAATPLPEVGTLTFDEIEGGCGMSLWAPGASPRQDGIYFFNGIAPESAVMKLDGSLVQLSRTAAEGEEFYGQSLSQTFTIPASDATVQIEVSLGEPGEIESVEIADGVITIENQTGSEEIPVEGDAGC